MRRREPDRARGLLAAVAAALALTTGPMTARSEDPGDPPDARIAVSGQVLDPDGRPLAGAGLFIRPVADEAAARRPRASTGPDGRFAVSVARSEMPVMPAWADPTRAVQVIAEAPGFGPAWSDPAEGTSGRRVALRLARDDVPIEGTIADLEGRPVAGARVRPISVSAGIPDGLDAFVEEYRRNPLVSAHDPRFFRVLRERPPSWPAELVADDQGRFRLAGVGRERAITLEVEGPGIEKLTIYVLTRRDVDLRKADRGSPSYRMLTEGGYNVPVFYPARFHHLANPSRPIEGTVTDRETGRPLAGVDLLGYIVDHESSANARTDERGRYRILGLATDGKLRINALPGKGQPYLRQVVERRIDSSEGPARVDIPLARGVLVRGRIVDGATKRGVPGWIFYLPFGDNPYLVKFPRLGADAPNYDVEPDGSFELVALPGPGVVAARAWEELYRASRPEQWGHPTDQGGFYSTANRGLVRAEEFHSVVRIDPDPKASELRCDVVLDPGLTLRGRLVDPDGRPVTDGSAFFLTATGMGAHIGDPAPDGTSFTAYGLDPEHPRLAWFLNKSRTLGRALRLPGPGAEPGPAPVTITLQPSATLVGRLLDADGRPRADAEVSAIVRLEPIPWGYDVVRTDAEGRFRITGLLPGLTYRLGGLDLPETGLGDITVRIGEVRDLGDIRK